MPESLPTYVWTIRMEDKNRGLFAAPILPLHVTATSCVEAVKKALAFKGSVTMVSRQQQLAPNTEI